MTIIDQGSINSQIASESTTTVRYTESNKRTVTAANGDNGNFDCNLDRSCLDHNQTNAAVII